MCGIEHDERAVLLLTRFRVWGVQSLWARPRLLELYCFGNWTSSRLHRKECRSSGATAEKAGLRLKPLASNFSPLQISILKKKTHKIFVGGTFISHFTFSYLTWKRQLLYSFLISANRNNHTFIQQANTF